MSQAWPHPIKAVIFDNDGTILDSLRCYIRCSEEIVGAKFTEEQFLHLAAMREREECQYVVDTYNLDMTPEEFDLRRTPRLHELLKAVDTIPGVEAVIHKIHEMGIPMVLATSSDMEFVQLKITKHHDLFSVFKTIVSGDDVVEGKPSPEIFFKAREALGDIHPDNILVFEDASAGVKAANLASLPVVMLTSTEGSNVEKGLEKAGAHAIMMIDRFEDFDFGKFQWAGN